MTRHISAAFLSLFFVIGVFAQEESGDVDSMFDEDGVTESDGSSIVDEDLRVYEGIRLSGFFGASAAIVLGWLVLPDDSGFWESFIPSAYALADADLVLEAHPVSEFGFYCKIGFDFPSEDTQGAFDWSVLQVRELYADWSPSVWFSAKIGKQTLSFGRGNLFTPANFVDGIEDGWALRVSSPLGSPGFSAVAFAIDSFFLDPENPTVSEIGYAAKIENIFGPVLVGASGFWQERSVPAAALSAQVSIFEVEVYTDIIASFNPITPAIVDFSCLLGFFWVSKNADLIVSGEYLFENYDQGHQDHSVALAAYWSKIGGTTLKAGIAWYHSFYDMSGQLLAGISFSPLRYFSIYAGVPFLYGVSMISLPDEEPDPEGRKVSFIIKADFKVPF